MQFQQFKGFKPIQNILNRYKLEQKIGQGSFGTVFKAHLLNPKIDCAIKVIHKQLVNKNPMLKNLVHNEMQILQKTSHPKIVRIFELLHDHKYFYIVMEYVRFGQLDDMVVKHKYLGEN